MRIAAWPRGALAFPRAREALIELFLAPEQAGVRNPDVVEEHVGLLRTRSAEHRAGSADRRSRTTAVNVASRTPAVEPLSTIESHVLQKLKPPAEEQFDHRLELLRRVDAESLRLITRAQHRRICLLQAAAWQTLGEWLSGEREDGQLASKYVLACLSDATQLWDQAELQLDIRSKVRWTSGRLLVGVTRIRRGRMTG